MTKQDLASLCRLFLDANFVNLKSSVKDAIGIAIHNDLVCKDDREELFKIKKEANIADRSLKIYMLLDVCKICGKPLSKDQFTHHCSSDCVVEDISQQRNS